MEIWKTVEGFENYQVSNLGRVKSLEKYYLMRNKHPLLLAEKILKLSKSNKYLSIGFCINGKQKRISIHRLVALAFIPNLENKPMVNHIDGNKLNNRVENLEWCTAKENTIHSFKIGVNKGNIGEKHPMVKITEKDVLEIRNSKLTPKVLAEIYNINRTSVYDIKSKRTWKHI